MPRRKNYSNRQRNTRRNTGYRRRSVLMKPAVQVSILLVVALIIFIILQSGGGSGGAATTSLAPQISVDEAYTMYQNGVFVLDVRTDEEWNEFHVPNTTLIPLDQLSARVNEIPRDRDILVVCRSGNRSQQGRDILLEAGFENVTSMTGGLNEWRSLGYPIE
ncbi:MAG TPA: rhodanese-like domain-containing protein [Anaerolineales bacterium]|nr:rhodanese-like domain-containing protein [Anaerolineales bacterium]